LNFKQVITKQTLSNVQNYSHPLPVDYCNTDQGAAKSEGSAHYAT
jgi:hypothetical protein